MNNIVNGRTLRSLRHAVWFSFVTAPALALFCVFIFLTFNNSLTGEFLNEARDLVAGTPPGKVWICAPHADTAEGRVSSPVPKPRCEPVMADAVIWQQSADNSIRDAYKILVILGAFTWWFCNGMAGLKDTGRWLKVNVMKINAVRRAVQGGHGKQDKE